MGELYRADLALWSAQQAKALRSAAREGSNAPVDWANVAEEIESLGASERRALASHLRTVIEHLMKLQASPAIEPRNGWRSTIRRARDDITSLLRDSPSLRQELPAIIAEQADRARKNVAEDMSDHSEDAAGLAGLTFDQDRVLGRWLP